MNRGFIWALLLLCLSGTGTTIGAEAYAPVEKTLPLGGLWKGKLSVLGGELDMTISVVPLMGGKYFAALDVPAQKVNRMLTEVTVRGDSVLLWMPAAGSRYAARFDSARRELNGVWSQAGLKSAVLLRHFPMPALAETSTRLAPPYQENEVVFSNPTSRLNFGATLTIPSGPGPFAAVVLVSDIGAQDRDGTVGDYRLLGSLADYLTRRGVAVLRYDDRGMGKSEGSTAAATTAMLVSDVQAAVNFLRSRLEVNINRIGVIGHGEGANVALLAAGQPLPPAFVVALAAYGLRGQETLLLQQVAREEALNLPPEAREASYKRQRAMYDIIRQTSPPQAQAIVSNMLRQEQPALDPQVTQDSVAQLLTPWRRYFLSFDPVAELDRVQCPVLLLSGTADEQAPTASHQQALEKELKSINRKVTAKRLPDVNHLFQPPITEWALVNGERKPVFSPAAQEIIRAWIEGLGKK